MYTRRETVHPIFAERVSNRASATLHNLPRFPRPCLSEAPAAPPDGPARCCGGIKCLSRPAAEVAEVSRRWRGAIGWSLINNSQAVLKPIYIYIFFYSTGGSFTTRELQQKCNPGFGAKHFYRWERSYCCSQNRGSRFHYDCVDRLQRFRVSVSFLPSNSSPRPLVFGSLITLRYSETKNRH